MIELRAGLARLEILPEAGGRIHQLWLTADGREEPVLNSPANPSEHTLHPLGGGCYPMAPWPNRISGASFEWAGQAIHLAANDGPNALHGLVFARPWEVLARVGRVVEMRCDLGAEWPWDGYAWQRVELSESGLLMKAEVRSRRETFPAGIGLHPWFRRSVAGSTDTSLEVPASLRYASVEQIPTGELLSPADEFDLRLPGRVGNRILDDCYTGLSGAIAIDWGAVKMDVTVECPEPHVMVYTTADAFCVEPQTCAPDAFNLRKRMNGTGFAVAEPGRAVTLVSRWNWQIM